MAQWTADRPPLPRDWQKRRLRVFRRDRRRCQLAYDGICTGHATEVDHIDGNADHRLVNLRSVCSECHSERTKQQSADAIRAMHARARVPVPPHPGLL
ncbi:MULTISPECIES: HNH endonuclease signature motif containing protein [unclassified Aeromicrobium]|uniref:HNH endonuclease signature motif containing protein n=1 Tax=unclassified Aeromicrobium TaxID=2633570 RepID=UPI00288C5518|nr:MULTISPECIES: HNH endonuclease signature motif containing protein [unclassified Aeromicrobium]